MKKKTFAVIVLVFLIVQNDILAFQIFKCSPNHFDVHWLLFCTPLFELLLRFCCFQTDADVPRAMIKTYGDAAQVYIRPQGDKYYVNLKAINAQFLRNSGVTHIEISTECTMCAPHRFWSHRVTKGNRGSQGAIIVCKGGSL